MTSPNVELPRALYRTGDVRALDRAAIEGHGIAGRTLMERAGAAAYAVLRQTWPAARRVCVLCGTGNNGGDGFVVARLAHAAGLDLTVYQVGEPERIRGDALASLDALKAGGITPAVREHQSLVAADVIVDALLGTGLDRTVAGGYADAIAAINASGRPVLAIDIPSGLHADTGQPLGCAVRAQVTVTFVGLKQGLFTGEAPEYCGRVCFFDLDVPAPVYALVPPSAMLVRRADFLDRLGRRRRTGHKGHYGHVLVIGGGHGYAGAPRMAAEAAARVGAGLVSVATRAVHAAVVVAGRPEIMSHGVEDPAELLPLIRNASVLAIGPGLGRTGWSMSMLACALERAAPAVIDADALNLLAGDPLRRDDWVLTPHPGEAARLLGCSSDDIQADRFAAARNIQRRYGGACVLKGAGTLIAGTDGRLCLCSAGNPGMASGGMGDVLTGVIAGLLAQGLSLADAACLGVCLHAEAGDRAAADGERGTLATDLMPWLRRLANP